MGPPQGGPIRSTGRRYGLRGPVFRGLRGRAPRGAAGPGETQWLSLAPRSSSPGRYALVESGGAHEEQSRRGSSALASVTFAHGPLGSPPGPPVQEHDLPLRAVAPPTAAEGRRPRCGHPSSYLTDHIFYIDRAQPRHADRPLPSLPHRPRLDRRRARPTAADLRRSPPRDRLLMMRPEARCAGRLIDQLVSRGIFDVAGSDS
jgi:hypothetical protein